MKLLKISSETLEAHEVEVSEFSMVGLELQPTDRVSATDAGSEGWSFEQKADHDIVAIYENASDTVQIATFYIGAAGSFKDA